MLLKILIFCASIAVLQAQTPADKAWEILHRVEQLTKTQKNEPRRFMPLAC